MIQPIPLGSYEALKILSHLKHDVVADMETIVGEGEQPEEWDVIGFTASSDRTFLLLGKRRFGQMVQVNIIEDEKRGPPPEGWPKSPNEPSD